MIKNYSQQEMNQSHLFKLETDMVLVRSILLVLFKIFTKIQKTKQNVNLFLLVLNVNVL